MFLDEPTTGLDSSTAIAVLNLLKEYVCILHATYFFLVFYIVNPLNMHVGIQLLVLYSIFQYACFLYMPNESCCLNWYVSNLMAAKNFRHEFQIHLILCNTLCTYYVTTL